MSEKEANTEETAVSEETVDEQRAGNLTFDQRLQLLQLERQIRMEEREAESEKHEYARQIERERREYESKKYGRKKKGQLERRNDLESLGMRRKSLLSEKLVDNKAALENLSL